MDDLDLAVDDVSRAMSLTFEKCPGEVLHLDLPEAWKLLELTGFFLELFLLDFLGSVQHVGPLDLDTCNIHASGHRIFRNL